jgi:predicted house-cleaning noncanonical NTP pyrophosphatase (MazG superfamily)
MTSPDLLDFLNKRMSMTDLYQPVIIRELLLHEGARTKAELAAILASYDASVQEYYEKIVMRWPKITLTKHGIIEYERSGSVFRLSACPDSPAARQEAVQVCEKKIAAWLDKRSSVDQTVKSNASIRYTVLKEARGKCQLCGISAEVRPIDIDHIVPRSKADKNGKIRLNGQLIDIDDRENLQALCFTCNRAKRASDKTDFRRKNKLVRDRIPEIIEASGRKPEIKVLHDQALRTALYDKLVEEHAEVLHAPDAGSKCEELADLIEVALALAGQYGATEEELMALVRKKRSERGGFTKGFYYLGEQRAPGT